MKKIVGILIGCGVVALAGVLVVIGLQGKSEEVLEKVEEKFTLSSEVYERGEFVEITAGQFDEMITAKKSFVVVVHMVICPAEFPVKDAAKQLAHDDGVIIYGLTEEEFKKTDLAKEIRYLPSVALIQEGKLVSFLDAESDEDLQYYKTAGDLRRWIEKRVMLNK